MLANVYCFVADNVHVEKQLFAPPLGSSTQTLTAFLVLWLGIVDPHLQIFTMVLETPLPPATHTPYIRTLPYTTGVYLYIPVFFPSVSFIISKFR